MGKWLWMRGADDTTKGVIGASALTETFSPVVLSSNKLVVPSADGQQLFGVCKPAADANITNAPIIVSNDYFKVPFTGELKWGDLVEIDSDGETVHELTAGKYPCGRVVDFIPFQEDTPSQTVSFCIIRAIFFNVLVDNDTVLAAILAAVTDGASGADNVGMTPITETGVAATVQAVVEALVTRLKAVGDGVSGADLLGMTPITETGNAATVQAVVEALIAQLKATGDGVSGADLLAITTIANLTAATVQAALEGIMAKIGDTSALETTATT